MASISGWNFGRHVLVFYNTKHISTEEDNERCLKISSDNKAYISLGKEKIIFNTNVEDLVEIKDEDIISISETGEYSIVYSKNEEIDLFMTNKCNSNCIMCPLAESVRRKNVESHEEWINEYIEALPTNVKYLNITGGEPTFNTTFFLKTMESLKKKFPCSDFQLLTNGRSMSDLTFIEKVVNVSPKGMRYAIPIHSSDEYIHDSITRSKGSFIQTDKGIKNLLANQQKVEIRVVVSKKNIDSLTMLSQYIIKEYPGVFCVNFMGMEMMGNAALNREDLWIDYSDAFKKCRKAIDTLVDSGIDVQLYNFPLCSVDRGYWHIAAQSITDYKVRFMEECSNCSVKEICGGFFSSTKQVMKPKVYPIYE